MPRASRRYLSKKVNEDLEENFSFLISSLSSSSEIENFFSEFLSREEKVMLSKRLMLHLMLEGGYKQSEINSVLGVSRETVRIHDHVWRKGNSAYKGVIKKLARRKRTKQFFDKVEKILKPVDLFLQSRTNMKARAKLLSGEYD